MNNIDTISRLTARLDQFVQWKDEYEKLRTAGEDVEDQLCNLEEDMQYISDLIASECAQCTTDCRRKGVAGELYKNDRIKADRLKQEADEIRKKRSDYKTVAEMLKEEEPDNGLRRCQKCGKYMEMSNVKEYVPDHCSYGSKMKRVVVGRLYKCDRCGTEEYEKIGR